MSFFICEAKEYVGFENFPFDSLKTRKLNVLLNNLLFLFDSYDELMKRHSNLKEWMIESLDIAKFYNKSIGNSIVINSDELGTASKRKETTNYAIFKRDEISIKTQVLDKEKAYEYLMITKSLINYENSKQYLSKAHEILIFRNEIYKTYILRFLDDLKWLEDRKIKIDISFVPIDEESFEA